MEGLAACAGDIRPVLDVQFRMHAWLDRRARQRRLSVSQERETSGSGDCRATVSAA